MNLSHRKNIWLLLLLGLMIYGCGNESKENGGNGQKPRMGLSVNAIITETVPLSQKLSLTGTLLAGEEVELKAESSGKLVELNIEEGKFVKKGQLLARVNDSEIRARLFKLELDLKLAQEDLVRKQRLREIEALSQQELDVAINRVDGINADIKLSKAQIEKAEVRSPFDGRIGLRNVSPGSFIGANTVLATLVQDNPIKLEFSIPERYAFGITKGKEITFTLGHHPKIYYAAIYATESSIDPGTRSLKVRALAQNPNGELIPGYFARVNYIINGNPKTLLIPPHALIPVLGGQSVVISQKGKASFKSVEIGARSATTVEIVSGIEPGDTLITSGLLQIREGMPVSITIKEGW